MSDDTGESLTKKVDAAFRQVAKTVIDRARHSGTPIILWENGQVVKRTVEEMELRATVGRCRSLSLLGTTVCRSQ
jgi:hypothetical protein